jgi:outer membrane receptor protein involved in Fe transport
MKRLRRTRKLASAVVFLMLATLMFPFTAPLALAQATTGGLRGAVTDEKGAVIPDADVTAKNDATGVENKSKTNGEGIYSFPRLSPGIYTLSVQKQGFKRQEFQQVTVAIGQEQTIDAGLQTGQLSETVTVTASGEELIQKEQSQVSNRFESRKVSELPIGLAGGGIDQLALLAPGVSTGLGFSNSNGAELSVNGQRGRSNNFTIDGGDNNDLTIGGPNLFVDNQDIVAEFQIITNNFSAEYGRNQGAVVNIVTKAGTNDFHGTVFEFHRNRNFLDSMDNIERRGGDTTGPPPLIRNTFGFTVGGPIKKNRAFFFASFQDIREFSTSTARSDSPTIAPEELARLSLIPGFATNPALQALQKFSAFAITDIGNVSERADKPRNATITLGGITFRTAYPQRSLPQPFLQPEFSARGDVKLTDKHTVYYRHLYQRSNETNALTSTQSGGFVGDIPFSSNLGTAAVTSQVSNSAVNEFRFVYNSLAVTFGGGCEGKKGCIPAPRTAIGETLAGISLTGIRNTNGDSLQKIGPANNLPQDRVVTVYQYQDNFSKTLGLHQFKMGADIRRLTNSVAFLPNINGTFNMSNPTRLVANDPLTVVLAAGQAIIDYKETDQFYYFQDDWRIKDNLTLNLGVRYEYTGQPINTLNDITTKRESDPTTALWRQNLPIEIRTAPRLPADKNNWAPRVGFAWRPRLGGSFAKRLFGEQDQTVVRGGYSIAYDPAFYNLMLNASTSTPVVFNNSTANPAPPGTPTFPVPANFTGAGVQAFAKANNIIAVNVFDPRLLNQTGFAPNFHSPYAEQWSFGIQRELARNTVLEIRYVGTHGVGLFETLNANPRIDRLVNGFTLGGITFPGFPNLVPSGVAPVSCVNNPATLDNEAICNGRIIAGHGLIRNRENTAQSLYHSLQSRFDSRMFNQLSMGMSYTFSKALDNASEVFSANESAGPQNPFDRAGERGYSGFDRRHIFAMNWVWDVPLYKDQRGFLGHVLGGWQLNGIYQISSGQRFTPSQLCNALCVGVGYGDPTWDAGFLGLDSLRPFSGNPKAPLTSVGMSQIDASFIFGTDILDPKGFYDLNALNLGNSVVVTKDQVRYIYNGPGAAKIFGSPYGNVSRGAEMGPINNNFNLGLFKNVKVSERVRLQLRLEAFNAFNHPNGGGVPNIFVEGALASGTVFNDVGEIEYQRRIVQIGAKIIF